MELIDIMIKNIIFDTGGVLITRGKTPMGELLARVLNISLAEGDQLWHDSLPDLLVGKYTSKEILTKWHHQFSCKHDLDTLVTSWTKQWHIFDHEINNFILNLLPQLKKDYQLFVLTDTIDLYDPLIETKVYPFMNKVFRSSEHKLRKPNPEAYLNLCQQCAIKPYESVFIDDKKENVIAAEQIGMRGITFTSNEDFLQSLQTVLN
jgi:HAD superfamily hydrolase (TIGR01509 family)